MKDYIVIRNGSIPDLVSKVNMFLEQGYLLAGGVSVLQGQSSGTIFYTQAVYKPK